MEYSEIIENFDGKDFVIKDIQSILGDSDSSEKCKEMFAYFEARRSEALNQLRDLSEPKVIFDCKNFDSENLFFAFEEFLVSHIVICFLDGKDYLAELPKIIGSCPLLDEILKIQSDDSEFIAESKLLGYSCMVPAIVDLLPEKRQNELLPAVENAISELGKQIRAYQGDDIRHFRMPDENMEIIFAQFRVLNQVLSYIKKMA